MDDRFIISSDFPNFRKLVPKVECREKLFKIEQEILTFFASFANVKLDQKMKYFVSLNFRHLQYFNRIDIINTKFASLNKSTLLPQASLDKVSTSSQPELCLVSEIIKKRKLKGCT